MLESAGAVQEEEVTYLFLPLAHAYALLIQLVNFDVGTTIAYFGGDSTQIVPELQQVSPTYLPSVPRIFEKIYTLALSSQPPEVQERMQAAAKLGVKVRDLQVRGEEVPPELLEPFEAGRGAALQERARDLRRARAPGRQRRGADRQGDPRVLLRLRRARARGLRHDRDRHGGHLLDDRAPPLRLGRPRAARRRGADRRRRRAAASRAPTSSRATGATTTPASARSSTAGCTPATWARSTRTATSTSRAARRTSSSPPAART